MKSLHTRLDDRKEEVLKFVETFGRTRAMAEFKVRDYAAFNNWIKEVTGNENFGLRPKISFEGQQTLGDQLVDAFLRKVVELEAESEKLKQRVEFLEWQLDHTRGKEDLEALAILDVCRT